MAIRTTKQSRTAHGQLVRALAEQYESQGNYVRVHHIAHPNGAPPIINGHIPDVAVYSRGTLQIVAETETCDTMSDSDTRDQWAAFARSPYRFEVIVPKSCLGDAQMQASLWGIAVDKWWWLDI